MTDGSAPDGTAPDGSAPDGSTRDGTAPDGSAPDGPAPGGTTVDGADAAERTDASLGRSGGGSTGLIAGRFRLGELLGSGGTASVFAAVDAVTGRSLAVKLLHPHLSESAPLREAFLEEARRAAQISHPCVVVIVDIGVFDDDGIPIAWIAQERVAGVTLAEHVRAHGALPAGDAVSVGADVLAGLEAAHASGLIHRDVSPSNVLVRRGDDGELRATLLDFGLADAAGRTAHGDDVLRSAVTSDTVGVVGNAQFASPEQLSGRPVGARGDLYQVGGLLFFALTGHPPFAGADRLAVVRAHLSAPPPVPSVRRPGLPAALDRVVVRALLKDPDDRFVDAAEMRVALRAAGAASTPSLVPAPSTRVLRPVAAVPAPVEGASARRSAADAPPPTTPEAGRERRGAAWGTVVGIIAVLVAAATAVPLMAGAGRSVPVAEATDPPPTQTPATSPTPTASAPGAVVPRATPEPASTVPALTALADAAVVLEAAGLRVGDVSERDAPFVAGRVIESFPPAGSTAPRGSAVRLVVASGSNTVPEVSGTDAADAASQLRAAGFATTFVSVVSDRPVGTVVSLEPAAGGSVPLGAEVRIRVSTTPAPAPSPSATPPTPAPTASPTSSPTPRAG